MIFNTYSFAAFFGIVYLLYWFVFNKNIKLQNIFLLLVSYFFYSWWDWRFLSLVLLCSVTNYLAGIGLMRCEDKNRRKLVLIIACAISLGVLGIFKYYNFFVSSFCDLLTLFNLAVHPKLLNLIIPVGLSFYTFHTLSYTIDVYNRKFEPTKDIVAFFLFVSIFPLAMCGPIERASNLLPQIYKPRTFDYSLSISGLRQILWGLFKKVVIADSCAEFVNLFYNNYQDYSGSAILIATVLFAFVLYCDFSGYSDMAIGLGKLLGFKFLRNFAYPYFATSFADYWKRNHISMTTWFMDYVYYPMVGNSMKLWRWNLCMIITFLLSGLWHGAGWTFIIWGLYQGIFIVISMNSQKRRKKFEKKHRLKDNPLYNSAMMIITFSLVCFGLIFFRAETISQAFGCIDLIFSSSLFSMPVFNGKIKVIYLFFLIGICMFIEWKGRNEQFGIEKTFSGRRWYVRWTFYLLLIMPVIYAISIAGNKAQQFVYFQF